MPVIMFKLRRGEVYSMHDITLEFGKQNTTINICELGLMNVEEV